MANKAQLGEIRTWKDGRKYQKTAAGWVPVKQGNGRTGQQEGSQQPQAQSSQFQEIDRSKINDVSELYGKVPGLKNEDIDSHFDETYDYLKEEMSSSDEDDIFSEALTDTVRWVNKQGMKSSQENENQESQQSSYTPEQLADYAKSASDEGLKRAASSGDEQMRVAAKREIARRKNEGMETETDNPFDKGSVQKSQKEERIFKGQVYEKVDGGWVKKMSDELEKGKVGQIGEIRTWGGKKYQKTPKGWRPVKASAQSGGSQEEETTVNKLSDYGYKKTFSNGGLEVYSRKESEESSQSERSGEESAKEKELKRDNEWAKTIREYTACGGGNFGKVLEKKPNGDLVVEYIRRGEKPWTDIAKKGSEDWEHLKDEKPSMQKKSSDITEDFDSYFEKIMDKLSESKNLKADVDKVGGTGTFERIMKEVNMRRWEDSSDRQDYIWTRIEDVLLDKVYDQYKERASSEKKAKVEHVNAENLKPGDKVYDWEDLDIDEDRLHPGAKPSGVVKKVTKFKNGFGEVVGAQVTFDDGETSVLRGTLIVQR